MLEQVVDHAQGVRPEGALLEHRVDAVLQPAIAHRGRRAGRDQQRRGGDGPSRPHAPHYAVGTSALHYRPRKWAPVLSSASARA